MEITDIIKRWESLSHELSVNTEYNSPNIYAIKPLLLDSFNRVYISENINRNMVILVEFNDPSVIKEYSFPSLKGIGLSLKDGVVIKGKHYLRIEKEGECPDELFISLSISITEMLSNTESDLKSIISVDKILKQYSNMFTKKYDSIGKEAEQGLYCELLYLEKMIEENGDQSIRYWTGPDKNKHDFLFENNRAAEIKSTTNQEQLTIHVSNENQLDMNGLAELLLKVYVVEENNIGETVNDVINRILALINSPDMYLMFKTDLALLKIDPDAYVAEYRFAVVEEFLFKVDNEFPRISKDMISSKIYDVKYKLNLSEVEPEQEQ